MRARSLSAVACLLLLVLALFASCGPQAATSVCTVVLVNPRSGQQASLGREVGRAFDLVTNELAAIGEKHIRIEEVDSQSSPTVARAEVERAVSRWNSPLVVGSVLSAETREFLQPLLERGVVVLANGSSDPAIRWLQFRKPGDGFFRLWPADDYEGRVMAEYVRSTNRAKRLVLFHANDPYAASLARAFGKRFVELGGVILGPETYPTDLTSFDGLVDRQPSSGHDGYYVVGFPADLAGIYNTLRRRADTRSLPIYSAVGIKTGEFTSLVRFPLDRLFFTAPAVDDSSGPYFRFRETYRRSFNGESPDLVAAVTYDALELAIYIVRSAGCNAKMIRGALYRLPSHPGASGETAFDALGDIVTKKVAIHYYESGRLLQTEVRAGSQ